MTDDPPDDARVQLRGLGQLRQPVLHLAAIAPDRLGRAAAMRLQPRLVGGQSIILVIPAVNLRENVPIAKKPKEAPGSLATA